MTTPPRLCVCGQGKVGRPLLSMLRARGFSAVGYDSDPSRSELSLDDAVRYSDAALFIVPTPSLASGAFSNEFLRDALTSFRLLAPPDYLYIVVSTTVPGSCDEFRSIVGDNLVYKPEFIRLEHVDADLLSPSFILIGSATAAAADACEAIYRVVAPVVPVHRMSLVEAELAKITLNCALTMKISLANQLHLVARQLGACPARIMAAVGADPRIGAAYLVPGTPYAGPCLPRDNRMFQFVARSVGVDAWLSQAADLINRDVAGLPETP